MIDHQHYSRTVGPHAETPGVHDAEPTGPYVAAADALEGDAVFNRAGERLGRVNKIILDVPGGRIAYAVLSPDGCIDLGDRLLAIPWRALTPDPERNCFVLDVSKEKLEQAPGFDKNHWPLMEDADWAREVHTYYRARPYYWE
jgi:hypothetical protein